MKKPRYIKKNGEKGKVETLLFGVIFSFVAVFAFSLIASLIIMGSKNAVSTAQRISLIVFLISGAVSGFLTSKFKGEGGILLSAISSVIFVMILCAIALVVSRGNIGGKLFMNYICYLPVAFLFAFLGKKKARRHKRR